MKKWINAALMLAFAVGCQSAKVGANFKLSPVPKGKPAFYKKHVNVGGFPILSSDNVSNYALKECAYILASMLKGREDLLRALAKNGVHFAVMGHNEFISDIPEYDHLQPKEYWDRRARGLGPTKQHMVVCCGEENLLRYRGDPYNTESICVHEFAHAIHHMALNTVDPSFDKKLQKIYTDAVAKGLWKGKYAGKNRAEYWAEGVQSWFDDNRENDHDHNHVNTRKELEEYDPDLAKLIASVFRNPSWRYEKPADRKEVQQHLVGYDANRAPRFVWPKRLHQWWKRCPNRVLPLQKPDKLENVKSTNGGKKTSLCFLNKSGKTRVIYWIDFNGKRQQPRNLRIGDISHVATWTTHPFLVTDEKGKALAVCYPDVKRTIVVLE